MRCLYEVLSIDKSANDEEIRKAYRKAALRWHPGLTLMVFVVSSLIFPLLVFHAKFCLTDKNQERLDEASARFKEVQNAYEVLSDKHEREWYATVS
jgi:DnaJ homolog subfamily A member 5